MVDFVVIICVICIMSPDDWAGVWLWRVSGGRRWSASGERSRRRASVQSVHRVKDRLLQSNPILEVGHVRRSVRRWRRDQSVKKNISKLQKAQNLLARVVTCSPQSCSPRTLLQQLHWLPIKHHIDFKIANITFRTLHSSQPAYLLSSLHACHSTRSLRLSTTNLLSAPFVRTSFGARSFSVAAPKIWNSVPLSLRTCTSPDTFRRHLKTHYCQQAFHSSGLS